MPLTPSRACRPNPRTSPTPSKPSAGDMDDNDDGNDSDDVDIDSEDSDDDKGEEDEDSSSACATPDLADGLNDVAPMFGLNELIDSHGQFFPEWNDIPSVSCYSFP